METIQLTYLIAWPVYVTTKLVLMYLDKQLRLNNANTRLEYIREAGERTLLSYQTLLWAYIMAQWVGRA